MDDWYVISNVDRIDSPALAFYPDRISGNIELAKRIIGDTNRLRPHVKTNKAAEVSRMLLDAGIRKFKCATIAEAEMLGHINAPDVLLAYQPVGPKISRLLDLIKAYPATHYSCLVDQAENARAISALCEAGNITLDVFIDLNVGMNRTGVLPERAEALVDAILPLKSLQIIGLHGYDGHIHGTLPRRGCSVRLDRTCVPGDIPQVCLSIGKGDGRYSYIPDVREAEGLRMQSRHVCVLGLGVWKRLSGYAVQGSCLIDNSGHFRAG